MTNPASDARPTSRLLMTAMIFALTITYSTAIRADEPDPHYWRLAEIQDAFAAWQIEHPDIFHFQSLGQSGEGLDIPMARISDNAAQNEAEPCLVFHAAQHANECNGTGAIMKTIATLLDGYGVDPAITERVDGLEMWFVPVLNPDGHGYVFSGASHWEDWRKTTRDNNENDQVDFPDDGVDMNRNWDWYWHEYNQPDPASQKYKGPFPWSEPEVGALRDFVLAERPLIVVDYHSPVTIAWTNYIFWPWLSQHGGGMSPDSGVASDIAEEWASQTQNEHGNSYNAIFAYDTLPKEQCWIYGRTGILTFVMEIATECWWHGATVDSIAVRVARGSVYLQNRALAGPGIRGVVTDAVTGDPLQAEVQIAEMHQDAIGPRLTEAAFGQYHRLTLPGQYTVQASLRNYVTETVSVTVGADGWEVADFSLMPEATAVEEMEEVAAVSATQPWLRLRNPLQGGQAFDLELPTDLPPATVALFDLRGRRIAVLGENLAADRRHQLHLPRQLAAGVYLLRATAGARQEVGRIVILP